VEAAARDLSREAAESKTKPRTSRPQGKKCFASSPVRSHTAHIQGDPCTEHRDSGTWRQARGGGGRACAPAVGRRGWPLLPPLAARGPCAAAPRRLPGSAGAWPPARPRASLAGRAAAPWTRRISSAGEHHAIKSNQSINQSVAASNFSAAIYNAGASEANDSKSHFFFSILRAASRTPAPSPRCLPRAPASARGPPALGGRSTAARPLAEG
jgi:hypothetical protein